MEEGKAKKRPLELDWNTLLPAQDDEPPPPMLVVNPSTKTTSSVAQPPETSNMSFDQQYPFPEGLQQLTDHDLKESIQSKIHTLETTGWRLPDKGEKLRATIKRYEDELGRRKMRRLEKEVDEIENPGKATTSGVVDLSNGLRQGNKSSQAQSESSFASCFYKKMQNTDCGTVDASKKELSVFKRCNNQKMRDDVDFLQRGRKRSQSSSRQLPFQCPSNVSERDTSNDDKRKDASQAIQLDDSRSRKVGPPIVLDDEDETHILEKTDHEDKHTECLKEAKIYYPSSDDPECVEICYTDIECLAPEGFLTSTIMNFYIRYLQQQASLTNKSRSDYHFFNTYFYKKLKEAVSYKRSDKEAFFAKFRRWWKGVNIFQKAYILIPIHEDLHWSLVIISIPDKKDESGPIILHLDSLGLHYSRSVFENIRSYLREEWKYLDQGCVSSDIPIADKIWKNLSRRIEDRILKVPQQKNEYDCGLFVLYFIERFIEEAPERLKKKDLHMFGNKWFKPEEASSLRVKICKLLKEEFQSSCKHRSSMVTTTDYVETA